MTLFAGNSYDAYQWNTGETSSVVVASNLPVGASTFIVEVFNLPEGCSDRDTVLVTVDNCSSIEESVEDLIRIYPNPFTDYLQIDMSSLKAKASIILYDSKGNIVKSLVKEKDQSVVEVSLNEEKGVYLLKIIGETYELTRQVIKQ